MIRGSGRWSTGFPGTSANISHMCHMFACSPGKGSNEIQNPLDTGLLGQDDLSINGSAVRITIAQ
jgi:hypothetical protein